MADLAPRAATDLGYVASLDLTKSKTHSGRREGSMDSTSVMKKVGVIAIANLWFTLRLGSGCRNFYPEGPRSNDRNGDKYVAVMLGTSGDHSSSCSGRKCGKRIWRSRRLLNFAAVGLKNISKVHMHTLEQTYPFMIIDPCVPAFCSTAGSP